MNVLNYIGGEFHQSKSNEWIDNLINNETMQFIDIDEMVQVKQAA